MAGLKSWLILSVREELFFSLRQFGLVDLLQCYKIKLNEQDKLDEQDKLNKLIKRRHGDRRRKKRRKQGRRG